MAELCAHIRPLLHYSEPDDEPFSEKDLKGLFNFVHPLEGTLQEQLSYLLEWFYSHL